MSAFLNGWQRLVQILPIALRECGGTVSSFELGRRLKEAGVEEPRRLLHQLRFLDWEQANDLPLPVRVHHVGRSFLSEEAHHDWERRRDREADEQAEQEPSEHDATDKSANRPRRQEETRLVRYVMDELENVYTNDWDEKRPCVFNVHQLRPLNDYENVDVLAVQWRSPTRYELVAVEVKLKFTAQLVQQANNYRRFADRVWIACPVDCPLEEAANWLQSENARLFDYVINSGLGILACKLSTGRRYDVAPIHWPLQNRYDLVDRDALLEAYYDQFVEAGVAAPMQPRFR